MPKSVIMQRPSPAKQLGQPWQGKPLIFSCLIFLLPPFLIWQACTLTDFRIISHQGSITQLIFSVNLPYTGDYAINISYLSPGDTGSLNIGINNQSPKCYKLRDTGLKDCGDSVSSTVVPVEVKGFTKGMNSIKLGNDGENLAPLIEWILVVVPGT